MSEKKTNVATGVAVELDQRDQQSRARIAEANATYWRAVQQAADGAKVTTEQAVRIADAMEMLDRTREDFNVHVQALRDVRELRAEGDREKAEDLREKLRAEADAIWARHQQAKKEADDLGAAFRNTSASSFQVIDRANATRAQAEQIALGLRQEGGAVLDELAVSGETRRMARVRCVEACYAGLSLRSEGDVFEMACGPRDLENPRLQLVAWLDDPEDEAE